MIQKIKAEIERRIIEHKKSLKKDITLISEAMLKGSLGAYESIEHFITSLQQEQPEVDLEKFTEKIKAFQGRYKHPEIVSIKGAMAFMARMFYQYPSVARKWYKQLPKATMDNARKEE